MRYEESLSISHNISNSQKGGMPDASSFLCFSRDSTCIRRTGYATKAPRDGSDFKRCMQNQRFENMSSGHKIAQDPKIAVICDLSSSFVEACQKCQLRYV